MGPESITLAQYVALRTQLSQDRRLNTPQVRNEGTSLLRKYRMSFVLNFDQHQEHLLGHVSSSAESTGSDDSALSQAIRGVRGCLGEHSVRVAYDNYARATHRLDKKLQLMAFGDFGLGIQSVADHLLEAEKRAKLIRNLEANTPPVQQTSSLEQRTSGLEIDDRWVEALMEKGGEDGFKAIDLIVQNLAYEKLVPFLTRDYVTFGGQTARDVYKILYKKLKPD